MTTGATAQAGGPATSTGSFAFDPTVFDPVSPEGTYLFYTQAFDAAGNVESTPTASAVPKAQTYFANTPPVITNIAVPFVSATSAQVSWTTNDPTTATVNYGTSTAFGRRVVLSTATRTFTATLDCHLLYPATILYQIVATNLPGLQTASPVGSFNTPAVVNVPTDLFGVVNVAQPITGQINNPAVTSGTYSVDGQSGSLTLSTTTAFQIFVSTAIVAQGSQPFMLSIDGFVYDTSFVIDTATRSVHLVRLAMDAGGVLTSTQTTPGSSIADMTLGQPAQGPSTGQTSSGYLSSVGGPGDAGSRLYLGYYAGIDPVAPGAITNLSVLPGPATGQTMLTWTAPGNDAYVGQAMIYDLRVSTNPINEANFFLASAVAISTLPALAGTTQQTVVAGLQNGTSYYFALKTFDDVLNVAAISNLVSTATFALARSTDLTNGLPTVSLITSVPGITVTEVASTGTYPALALATSAAAAQGLIFAGGIYDINSPLNPLPGGGTIQFQFDPTGLDPTTQSELRIYHFNLSIDSWTLLADIPPAFGSDVLIAPVSSFSPYAVMLHDTLPPITTLSYQGGKQYLSPSGGFFISTATSISLSARDPPIGRFPGTGVRLTEYRVDSALGPFIPLNPSSSSIQFAPGLHTVDYNSIDYAGNTEPIRSAAVGVDAAPPSTTLGFVGGGQAAGPDASTFYVSSSALAAYSSTDPVINGVASGVAFTQFQVDGGTLQIYGASTAVALASGTHTLAFQSQDNVGNLEPPHVANVWVDAAPPAATFTFPKPGAALNNQSPLITVVYSDPALAPGVPGSGVNPASIRVLVDNVDVSSQATITAAQVQLSANAVPDGVHLIIVTVADRVGNSTSTALIFTTNTTPPAVAVSTPMNGTYFRNQFPTISAAYSDYRSGLSSGTIALKLDGAPVQAALTLTGSLPGGQTVGVPLGWTQTTPLPDVIQGMAAATWNGYVYSLGGSDNTGHINNVYVAKVNPDGSLGSWVQTTPLPNAGYQLRAAVWGNTIYVAAGTFGNGAYYAHFNGDGTLGAWTPTASIPLATGDALDVAADNGFLYVFGGGVNCNDREVFFAAIHADGSLGNWTPTTPLPLPLVQFQTAVAQGVIQIYLPGGAYCSQTVESSSYYSVPDPVTGQLGPWVPTTSLPQPIYQNVTLATDGNLYVLENYPQAPIVAFAPFMSDHSLGAWTNDTRYYLPAALAGSGGAATATNLYVIGGYDLAGKNTATVYTTALTAGIATLATASFTPATPLAEGTHTVTASVFDQAGNLNSTTTVFGVDLTAPVSTAAAGPPVFVSSAGLVYVGTSAPVALSAYDPIINGAASGVDHIAVSVDSGPFAAYGSTFTFAEGIHSLLFSAVDKAGNAESTHALTLRADATPPVTALVSSGAVFMTQAAEGPRSYASGQTFFSLQTQDPVSSNVASGVAFTQFRTGTLVNYLTSPQFLSFNYAFQQFVSTFNLAEGIQRVDFQSQDNVGNLELVRSATVFVDATPPRTAFYAGEPVFVGSDGTYYVTPATTMTLTAYDPPLPQAEPPASTVPIAGSGVNHTEVAVDTTAFIVYAGTLGFSEGLHNALYRSIDNVGNAEPVNRLSVTSDNTPPLTTLSPSGTFYITVAAEGPRNYASGQFSYGFSAADPVVNGAASGVAITRYRTDQVTTFSSSATITPAPFQVFSSTFGLPEGISRIEYQSQDNVWNLELLKAATIFVDATPPVSSATIGSPQFTAADGTVYVASTTLIAFSAVDPALNGSSGSVTGSGVNRLEVAIDSGAFAVYAATLTFAEGQHTILYRAVDNVGNVEAAHTMAIRVDATPPVTSIALSTPNYIQGAGQPAFVSAATILSLSAFDLVVNGVASGVALTRYQVSGSSFAPLAFSLSGPDGTYTVSYQSVDNVGNTEVLRSTTVLLDQTPPVTTAHVGASSFTATDGSLYVTPATPITFTAVDPSSGGAASGVNRIETAVDGGTFTVYAATLTFAEGQHTILYRGVDNVGNVEAAHTLTLRSDATPPVTTVAVGSPTYTSVDETVYVTPATPIAFSAADPALPTGQPGSGVNQIDISIDSGPFTIYASSLALAEGSHTILYRSVDNVGNTETIHTLAVKSDATPPFTLIALSTPNYSHGTSQPAFVGATTILSLSAFDPVVNGVASGVALTRYQIDGGPFVSAPSTFGLSGPDGTYAIAYQSVDNVGNTEILRSTTVLLDQTPPVTTANVGASSFTAADGSLYVTPATPITFTAVDPSSGSVASGVNHIETAVDGGTFAVFAATLTFAEGQHTVLYRAVDNVGNVEAAHTLTLRSDATPPVTTVAVGSPTYASADGSVYVTPATPVSFTAADPSLSSGQPGSGVNHIDVSIDSGPFTMVASSLTFAEGPHTILYRSLDNVGNTEAIHILSLKSDATPPVTTIAVSTPSFADYVSGATILSLSAVDPISHGVAAGVKATYVAVGSAAFAPAVSGFALAAPDGAKTISFYSQDNVLNTETVKSTTVLLDATPPQTTLAILGGRQYPVPAASGFYASSSTLLAFAATDPIMNGVASGVAFTQYQDCGSGTAPCGSPFQVFGSAFGLSEGAHNIGYQSQDRVQNPEVLHSTTVLVDATPPVTTVLVGSPTYTSPGGTVYVAPASPINFSAADPNLPTGQPGSGVNRIDVSIDGGPFVAYSSAVYLAEGAHAIAYRSVDNVGNAEATRTIQLQSDATPPVTTIALSTPNYSQSAGQPAFVSAATILSLSAFDPVANGVAVGIALTRYQLNGGPFVSAPSTFGLSGPDGTYTIAYQSVDNVGNTEVLRSTTVLLDQTPPVTTAHIGAASFTASDGSLYVTPATPITFTAVDPSSGGAASGVNHLEAAIDGGTFAVYAATLTFAEGQHTILYRAVDNVGNVEAAHTLTLRSDATPPVTTVAVGSPTYTAADGTVYVTPATPIALSAADPALPTAQPGSGVRELDVSIDSGPFSAYISSIMLPEGSHTVAYRSVDNVGNAETARTLTLKSDATPPVSAIAISSPSVGNYVSTTTVFNVSALDPMSHGVASGVKATYVAVGGGAFSAGISSFTLSVPDGPKLISFYSQDNVFNTETVKSTTVLLDATPPQTALAILGGRQYPGPAASGFYASLTTLLAFVANDPLVNGVASGVAFTQYQDCGSATAPCGSPFQVFGSAFGLSEGAHDIGYQSQDRVQNLEVLHSTTVLIDATPPVTTVLVGSPTYTSPGGTVYVAPASPITFSAVDPNLPTGQPGSGVNQINISIDSGPFVAYSSAVYLAEGRHTIAYRSLDNVGNAEAGRMIQLQSDATPPVTSIAIGAPQLPLSGGITAISTLTAIGFQAADPVVNGVASGVRQTQYSVAGGPYSVFTTSFTPAPTGAPEAIGFFSQDNVANTEAAKTATVLVDTVAPTILIGSPIAGATYVANQSTIAIRFSVIDPYDAAPSSVAMLSELSHLQGPVSGSTSAVVVNGQNLSPLSLDQGIWQFSVAATNALGLSTTVVTGSFRVIHDIEPPRTTLAVGTPQAPGGPQGSMFVSSRTAFTLSSIDDLVVVGDGIGLGTAFQELIVDTSTPVTFPNPSPQAGQVFASTFSLSAEGLHYLEYFAQDVVGNREAVRAATAAVDNTPPVAALSIGLPQFISGGATYVSTATSFALASQDPLVNGVASGVNTVYFRIDANPYAAYAASFTLPAPDGARAVGWFAADNVGNQETTKSVAVDLDATPPVTALVVAGGRQFPGPDARSFYASSATLIAFAANDAVVNGVASGLAFTRYQDCGSAAAGCLAPFQVFAATQAAQVPLMAEGVHSLGYQSQDHVANLEILRSTAVLIDATPPVTTAAVGQPSYTSSGGTLYISTSTPISFSAADPALFGTNNSIPGSGVNRIEISIDGAPFAAYGSALSLAEGAHTIVYRAVDNVGNTEASRTLAVQADATPPVSSLSIGQPQFAVSSSTVLVSSRTPFSITAVDPVVNGVASGVRQSFYRINNSSFTGYSAAFTLAAGGSSSLADGIQTINFYSQDNVLNTEAVKSVVVTLDATAPQAAILSPSASGSGICRVLKGVFPVLGSALDTHLASYTLDFAPGQNATSGFTLISSATFGTSSPGFGTALVGVSSAALGVWNASALSGWQTLRLTATDLVQNATVVTVNVYVGDPAELLVLGNHTLFNMPRGVAVDSGRDIYVADTNDNQIKEFTSSGTFLAAFGLGDGRGHSRNFDPDDNPTASTAALRLNKPKGVAVDAAGNIYIADTNNDRVLELSAAGQVVLELGKRSVDKDGREHFKPGNQPGEFNAPSAVAVGPISRIQSGAISGNIYVADTENRRVQVFTSTGGAALVFYLPPLTPLCAGTGASAACATPGNDDDSGEDGYPPGPGVGNLGRPEGIAVDLAGNIYVADPQGSRALKFDPTGKLLLTIPILGQPGSQNANSGGSGPSGPLVQSEPNGTAVSPSGDCILVSDRKFARILKFDALGNQLLAFGTQGKIPDNQAPPSSIVFQKPVGLALDALGNLYVADRNNDRVEEFGLPTGQPTLVVPPPVSDPNAARDVVASADGGAVSRSDGASVQVPPGALAQDLKITVSTATDQDALQISLASKKAGDKGLQVAYAPISFSPEGTQFQQAVTLVMPYTPDLLLAQGITEDQLAIDYWNPAKSDWEALPSVVDKANHLVTAKTSHFSLYQVHSGTGSARALAAPPPAADPTFVFRDLYAFPNPALRGKSPTIRLQVGVADSVEIHIYDISGKLVHQAGISVPPQPLDDGNGKGAQYTYDYPWDVSGVGSGVYIYSVTAKKSGKTDIRRIKKLGVVK